MRIFWVYGDFSATLYIYIYIYMYVCVCGVNMPCVVADTFEYFNLRLLLAAEIKGGTRR